MSSTNLLNVFKGPAALAQYFDPDENPPLPLVELPGALNPLRADGVRIFAKMLTASGVQNVKSLPALKMLLNEPGASSRSIVEASSGSTVLSMGVISRALWGHKDVHAYVTNKKHMDSLKLLRFFGLKIALYGGLAQQEPSDPKGIMSRLRRLAEKDPGVCYPGQYDNDNNWKAHEQWTGPQIWKQLPETNVFCATIGTGGCVTGTGVYLKSKKPSVKIVGVCNVFGDPTPGPRHFSGFQSSPFPWSDAIDIFETASSVNSYRTSMHLSRHGIIAGPSSGAALQGLLTYLQTAKSEGRLSDLRDETTGEITCVFVCADLPYQYMDMYFKKLAEDEFPLIYNRFLLTCDLNPYDERWFLAPDHAAGLLSSLASNFLDDPFCATPSSLCVCGSCTPRAPLAELTLPVLNFPTRSATSSSLSSGVSTALSSPSLSPHCPAPCPSPCPSPCTRAIALLDIRPATAFACAHLHGARSMPLPETRADLFGDAEAVQQRWGQLTAAVDAQSWLRLRHEDDDDKGGPGNEAVVLVLSSDCESGRMATSILRARGREAYCVEGGYAALLGYLKQAGGASNDFPMREISIGVSAGHVGKKLRLMGFVVVLAVVYIVFLG